MDFVISRIEHYKMRSVTGVYRESSRGLSSYPNDVDESLSYLNHCFTSYGLNPKYSIPEQIRKAKSDLNIKGRFIESAKNEKSETNVMSQAFFKITDGYLGGKDRDEIIDAYWDCLQWFNEKYPSIVILDSYIHFDEPAAGPHMHVNFLPIFQDTEKDRKIFSTSKVFEGKAHFERYQDSLHRWACKHFDFSFDRRKPDSLGAKHLSVPEYKKAMAAVQELETKLDNAKPVIKRIEHIEAIGTPTFFGNSLKVEPDNLDDLKETAIASLKQQSQIDTLMSENKRLAEALEKEKRISRRLQERLKQLRRVFEKLIKLLDYNNTLPVFVPRKGLDNEAVIGAIDIELQKKLDNIFDTNFAEVELKRRSYYKMANDYIR